MMYSTNFWKYLSKRCIFIWDKLKCNNTISVCLIISRKYVSGAARDFQIEKECKDLLRWKMCNCIEIYRKLHEVHGESAMSCQAITTCWNIFEIDVHISLNLSERRKDQLRQILRVCLSVWRHSCLTVDKIWIFFTTLCIKLFPSTSNWMNIRLIKRRWTEFLCRRQWNAYTTPRKLFK